MNSSQATPEVRWQQRFSNYKNALARLSKFLKKKKLNELEEQGLIQAFEYTFEFAWKTLQDLLQAKGYLNIKGPNPTIMQSFQDGYISDGPGWAQMRQSRNTVSHVYDESATKEIAILIRSKYCQLFTDLQTRLEKEEK